MKKLIINADDFGLTEGINKGIVDCYKKRIVTDISLIAGADSFKHAINLAKDNNIRNIGAHILFSETIEPQGFYRFPWKYSLGKMSDAEIELKIKNQILKIKDSGFIITHLDSHQHIHIMPRILKIFVRLAKEFNIRFIRFPYETKVFDMLDLNNTLKVVLLRGACIFSKGILVKSGLDYNDFFYGHFYAGGLDIKKVLQILPFVKDGVTELSCHPGYLSNEIHSKYIWHRNCEQELQALCDPEFQTELKRNHIELVSHADI